MNIQRTQGGIYHVINPLIDLGIDKNFSQINRSRLFGLLNERTIYVPNNCVPQRIVSGAPAVIMALATLAAGCAGLNTKDTDYYIEQNNFGDSLGRTTQTRYELTQNGKKTFVAEHEPGDYTKASARIPVDMPEAFKGYVTVFGETRHDSDKTGIGGDFDVKTKDGIILGGTAEKTSLDNELRNVYIGKEFKNFIAKAGVGELSDKVIYQSMLGQVVETKDGGFCFGLGGLFYEQTEDGQLAANIRRFNRKKGEGFGFDLWSKSDLEGNTIVKGKAALKGSTIGKTNNTVIDITELGLNALSLVPNAIERLPFDHLCGDTVLVGKYTRNGSEKEAESLALYNNFGRLGILKDFRLGLKATYSEDLTAKLRSTIITPSIGFNLGPFGIWYEVGLQDNKSPDHFLSVWMSFSDLYKALGRKAKE